MTWLFIRFYAGVLAVLFLAWYIHGWVHQQRSAADLARVIVSAHAGGAKLVAQELDRANDEAARQQTLEQIRQRFVYPVALREPKDTPDNIKKALGDREVAYHRDDQGHFVATALSNSEQTVWLGPFPSYDQQEVEGSIGGWMLLAGEQVAREPDNKRLAAVQDLQPMFEFPLTLMALDDLPDYPRQRIQRSHRVVFYEDREVGEGVHFSVTPVGQDHALRFGPFPSFQKIEQKAATTTLALVLLPAAFAIAMMLRPVTRQLRHVENAAKAIAEGDLDARVDESRVHDARPLAHAFNLMADQTASLLKSQKELLQAVSHELRTPLARIRFAADLLDTAATNQERQKRLQSLDDATQQLDDLVGELLAYVRSESADAPALDEPFSIQELFSDIVSASVNPRDVELAIDRSTDLMVLADRRELRRAVSNLTRNAARYARNVVRLSVAAQGTEVLVRVDDDGPGVAAEDRQRIFAPFVRLEDNGENGSGLGLALVQRIAASHGGSVRCVDSPIGGARFELSLPASVASEPTEEVAAKELV